MSPEHKEQLLCMAAGIILGMTIGVFCGRAHGGEPPPPACAPGTPYEICGIIVQRNNAENDLINVQALRHREGDYWEAYVRGATATVEWYQHYIAGLEEASKLAAARAFEKGARR